MIGKPSVSAGFTRIGSPALGVGQPEGGFSWSQYWATRYPSLLTLTVDSDTQITLSWTNNGDVDYDGVSVERSTDGVTYAEVTTIAAGLTTYINTGLIAGTLYYYQVRYYRGTHYSAYSNVDNAATLDSYGQAFITATGISDGTSITAISNLVYDLLQINATQANFVNFGTPASSICRAIYPFVGSTATTQKYNLIDPRDLDAAFRIAWGNDAAGAHTSDGYKPDGVNQYGDTKLNSSTVLTLNSSHLSIYALESKVTGYAIGNYLTVNSFFMSLRGATDLFTSKQYGSAGIISVSNCTSVGYYIGSRTAAASHHSFKDGLKMTVSGTTSDRALPNRNVWIGGISDGTTPYYVANTFAFASVGSGITDAAAALYDAAVYKYVNKLGRATRTSDTIHAGVCFTIDDTNSLTTAKQLIPCVSYYGWTATNFLEATSYTAGEIADETLFLNADCEIGTHVNIAPRVDPVATVWTNQINPVHNAIVVNFAVTPVSFAYHVSAEIDTELLAYLQTEHNYLNIRVTEGETGTPYYVDGDEIIGSTLLSNLTDFATVSALIDYAFANDKILIIYMHKVGVTVDNLTVTYALAERLIAYAKSKNMTFYKFSELVAGV